MPRNAIVIEFRNNFPRNHFKRHLISRLRRQTLLLVQKARMTMKTMTRKKKIPFHHPNTKRQVAIRML
jgi:hypothetical protein